MHALLSANAYNAAETRLKKFEAINEYLLYGNLKVFEKIESIEKRRSNDLAFSSTFPELLDCKHILVVL